MWESNTLVISCASGHMLRDPSPNDFIDGDRHIRIDDLPIVPDKFIRHVDEEKLEAWDKLQALLQRKDIDGVIHAGDPDDEGQRIVDDIINASKKKYKNVKRFLCGARAEDAIKKAFANLKDNKDYELMGVAADCRSQADWIVGMNYSIFYRSLLREKNISYGRVQTPTVYLVYKREREIKNFKPSDYFLVQAKWNAQGSDDKFSAKFNVDKEADYVDSEGRIAKKSSAEAIVKESGTTATIQSFSKKKMKKNPPKGLTQTDLQVEAGRRFGISPEDTMEACQSLYTKEVISYPRSKRNEFEMGEHDSADKIIEGIFYVMDSLETHGGSLDLGLVSPAWTKKEYEHYALSPIVTNFSKFNGFEGNEEAIYTIIAERFLMQFLPPATSEKVQVTLLAGNGHRYSSTVENPIDNGWMILSSKPPTAQKLPDINEGDKVDLVPSMKSAKTSPPSYYTKSTLINAMATIHHHVNDESLKKRLQNRCEGIGTEATRFTIPGNAIDKGHLKEDRKGFLHPTPLLERMMEVADESVCYPDTTAVWDLALEMIREGKQTPEAFMDNVVGMVEDVILGTDVEAYMPERGNPCPKCKGHTIKLQGKFGVFFACEKDECDGRLDADGNEKVPFKKTKGDPANPKCPKCNANTVKRKSKKGVDYFSCEDFPDCKGVAFEEVLGAPCPKCGLDTVLRKGKKGDFYSCKEFPKCKGILPV